MFSSFSLQYNTAVWHYQIYSYIFIYLFIDVCTCAEKKVASAAFFCLLRIPSMCSYITFSIFIDWTRHREYGTKPTRAASDWS
ncbi:hypothetical protein FKM82_012129 [Ascaphus truei]